MGLIRAKESRNQCRRASLGSGCGKHEGDIMAGNMNPAPRGEINDTVVQKVGVALGQITQIRETYAERLASVDSEKEKQMMETEAQTVMVKAVSRQGLSVEQFNAVVSAAEADPDLERRVLAAAKAA
jgi:hypothetical protein